MIRRKRNTTPCWRKEITVGAIFRPTDDGGTGRIFLVCRASWRHRRAIGKGEGTREKKQNSSTHSKIRLKVRICFICICATVIKGTIAQCVMLY